MEQFVEPCQYSVFSIAVIHIYHQQSSNRISSYTPLSQFHSIFCNIEYEKCKTDKKIKTQEPCPIESLSISILHIHHQERSTSVSSNPPLPQFHTAIHHLIVHKNLLDFFLCGTSWAGRELQGVVKYMRPGDYDDSDDVDDDDSDDHLFNTWWSQVIFLRWWRRQMWYYSANSFGCQYTGLPLISDYKVPFPMNNGYRTHSFCVLGLGEKSKIKIKTCALGF